MKEGLPVDTGAGRIEYKMNENNNSDGFFDRHESLKKNVARGVAVGLAVTGVGTAVEGVIPKDVYAASAVVDRYSGEIPSEKELNNVFAKNGLVLATSETVTKPEKQSELSKINVVFQVGNPYYVTFDLDKYTFAVTKLDASPVIDPKSGRTMVPVGFVGQSMGYEKQWDNKNKIVTFEKGDRTVVHKVGTKIYDIKIVGKANQRIVSDSTSYIDSKTGRTMVGLRSCLNSFGIKDEEIGYDSKNKLIYCNFSKEEQVELAQIPMGSGPNYEAEREALKYIKPDFKDNGDVQKLDDEMKKQGYAVFAMSGVTVVMPESIYNDTSNKINAYEKAILLSTDVYEAEIVKRVGLDQYTKDSDKTKLVWQQKSGKIYSFEGNNGRDIYSINGSEKTKVQYNAKTGEFKEEVNKEKIIEARKVLYGEIQKVIKGDGGFMWRNDKKMCDHVNMLHFDKQDVEVYLKTGVAKGFEAVKDSNGLDVAIIMNNEFGLGQNKDLVVDRIDWLRTNDPEMFKEVFKNLKFIASNFGYIGLIQNMGGDATWNSSYKIIAIECNFKKDDTGIMSCFLGESEAIKYDLMGWSLKDGGIQKGKDLTAWAQKMLNQGKISEDYFKQYQSIGMGIIDYYKEKYQ